MQSRQLGSSDVLVSPVIFGAWAIGGWMWGGSEEKDSIAAIHASIAVAEPCRRFCKGGGMALARGCRGYIGEAKPPSHPKVISQISPSVRQSK